MLEVIDPADNELSLNRVSFKNVYYGDTDTQKIVVFNNSPVNSNYLISLDPMKSHCITVGNSLAITIKRGELNKSTFELSDLKNLFQVSPSQVHNYLF